MYIPPADFDLLILQKTFNSASRTLPEYSETLPEAAKAAAFVAMKFLSLSPCLFYSTPFFFSQNSARQHLSQYGFVRAVQTARPCSYKSVAEIIALFRRDDLPESHLHFFGSLIPSTRPIRFVRRIQWVSVTIAGFRNTSP